MQEIESWLYNQMVYAQTRVVHTGEWDAQNRLGFWDTNRSLNLSYKTRPNDCLQKKRTGQIVNSAIPVNHKVKIKQNEKRDKYFDLARELKKLWNMKVTVIPNLIGMLGTNGLVW